MTKTYCPQDILGHLNNGCAVGSLDGEITVVSDTHVQIQYGTIAALEWEGCAMTVTEVKDAKTELVQWAALPLWLEQAGADLEFYTPEAASFYRNSIQWAEYLYYGGGADVDE